MNTNRNQRLKSQIISSLPTLTFDKPKIIDNLKYQSQQMILDFDFDLADDQQQQQQSAEQNINLQEKPQIQEMSNSKVLERALEISKPTTDRNFFKYKLLQDKDRSKEKFAKTKINQLSAFKVVQLDSDDLDSSSYDSLEPKIKNIKTIKKAKVQRQSKTIKDSGKLQEAFRTKLCLFSNFKVVSLGSDESESSSQYSGLQEFQKVSMLKLNKNVCPTKKIPLRENSLSESYESKEECKENVFPLKKCSPSKPQQYHQLRIRSFQKPSQFNEYEEITDLEREINSYLDAKGIYKSEPSDMQSEYYAQSIASISVLSVNSRKSSLLWQKRKGSGSKQLKLGLNQQLQISTKDNLVSQHKLCLLDSIIEKIPIPQNNFKMELKKDTLISKNQDLNINNNSLSNTYQKTNK